MDAQAYGLTYPVGLGAECGRECRPTSVPRRQGFIGPAGLLTVVLRAHFHRNRPFGHPPHKGIIVTDQFGLINLPYIPMELIAFTDVGVAWDDENPVDFWGFSDSPTERIPLFASGVGARFNLLGMFILEAYYAYPYQRPDKGWHWGFNLAPGW